MLNIIKGCKKILSMAIIKKLKGIEIKNKKMQKNVDKVKMK